MLRDYQQTFCSQVNSLLRQGETRLLGVAATGAGKTVIAAFLIKQLLKGEQRVLFVVHRDILIAQTLDKIERLGLEAGIIAGRYQENRFCRLQVASVQTLSRRDISWFSFKVAFFDECHITSWAAPSLKLFPPLGNHPRDRAACIGLTATPWRTSRRQSMGDLYRQVVLAPLPQELLERGYLTKPVYRLSCFFPLGALFGWCGGLIPVFYFVNLSFLALCLNGLGIICYEVRGAALAHQTIRFSQIWQDHIGTPSNFISTDNIQTAISFWNGQSFLVITPLREVYYLPRYCLIRVC